MTLVEIVESYDHESSASAMKREICRSLRPTALSAERSQLIQLMYGQPDETDRESLEVERIRSEIAVKHAEAAKKRAEAEDARSATQTHSVATGDLCVEMYHDTRGEWRWQLVARNGKIIAISSEGYADKADCQRSICLVKASSTAPVHQR